MFKEGDIIKMKVVKYDGDGDECRLKCPFGDECGQQYHEICYDFLGSNVALERIEEE